MCLHVNYMDFMTHLPITNNLCPRFRHGCAHQLVVTGISNNLFALNVINVFPQKGDHFLYLQRLNPNTLQRYRLEREEPGLSLLSFSASYRDKHICLLYLCKPESPVET